MAPPRQRVSAQALRDLFNNHSYLNQALQGGFQEQVVKSKHPSPPKAAEPFCTRSEAVAYFDEQGAKVAVAHRFVRPDGSIGGSGFPDPKQLLHEGVVYYV